MNTFKIIDYITRKRKICRDLMIKKDIPQYCFDQFYINKSIPDNLIFKEYEKDILVSHKLHNYFKYPLISISIEDIDKTDEQILEDTIKQCESIIEAMIKRKEQTIINLEEKVKSLKHRKAYIRNDLQTLIFIKDNNLIVADHDILGNVSKTAKFINIQPIAMPIHDGLSVNNMPEEIKIKFDFSPKVTNTGDMILKILEDNNKNLNK